ncbi:MAG: putative Amino acid transporter [Promethearchaeota archaeon]|nr:MAG: putative Amino acid transporter [Candidatus Lokiarchaeota archaeon]
MNEIDNQEGGKLKRELGLTSIVFFLFGYIVGAGILLQTGTASAQTGPGIWLAFIIAGIPNMISAIIIYYIASAFPVSGGAWVYSSRLISPFIGFLVLISIMIHIIGSLAFISIGFGRYFESFLPGSTYYVALIILTMFFLLNLLGVKFAGWVQVALAIFGDFLILVLFIIIGLPNIDVAKLAGIEQTVFGSAGGLFPNGIGGVFVGAVILSFSYAGFTAIVEIGGEIKNPRRTVPLGLFISLIMVMSLYILISIVFAGNLSFFELETGNKTIINVFEKIGISGFFLAFLNILVLIAIGSTLHGIILAYSRNLFSAARDRILPTILSKVNKRFSTPHWAVTFFCVSSLILLIFRPSYDDLQYYCALTITIPTVIIAFAPYLLEKKYPELLENSKFKIKKKYLLMLIIFNVAYSALSILAIIGIKLYIVLIVVGLYAIAIIYYVVRRRWLKKRGFDLNEICQRIPEETKELL